MTKDSTSNLAKYDIEDEFYVYVVRVQYHAKVLVK